MNPDATGLLIGAQVESFGTLAVEVEVGVGDAVELAAAVVQVAAVELLARSAVIREIVAREAVTRAVLMKGCGKNSDLIKLMLRL